IMPWAWRCRCTRRFSYCRACLAGARTSSNSSITIASFGHGHAIQVRPFGRFGPWQNEAKRASTNNLVGQAFEPDVRLESLTYKLGLNSWMPAKDPQRGPWSAGLLARDDTP